MHCIRAGLILAQLCAATAVAAQSPQAAAAELITADRTYSASGAALDLASSLAAMFAPDVVMPQPEGKFARGREAAVAALAANPANSGARMEWAPVRAGVSADGQHGFTFGFTTIRRGNGPIELGRYLAYWVKSPAGWQVAAYKRTARAEGPVLRESMPPSLPDRIVPQVTDASVVSAHRAGLIAAEQGFSDLAQRVGLGAAFRETGRSDAINIGAGNSADFVYGNGAIAQFVSAGGAPNASPFTWSADDALVASSGDLGVTFGIIHQNGPAAERTAPAGFAFFTIWRRQSPQAPWKYIAE